jgi:transposase
MEAAHFAIRYNPAAARWYQRKLAKKPMVLARKALAHKLARACYFLIRDGGDFDSARLFG